MIMYTIKNSALVAHFSSLKCIPTTLENGNGNYIAIASTTITQMIVASIIDLSCLY